MMNDFEHLLNPRKEKVTSSAGFLRRAGAFIFDILILDLIVTTSFTPLFANLAARAQSQGFLNVAYTSGELGAMIALFLVIYVYFALFEYLLGQTPGMMLFRIRVGEQPLLWQALVRNSFIIPTLPFVILWIVEPLLIMFKRRGVLEVLTKTRTIHTREVLF